MKTEITNGSLKEELLQASRRILSLRISENSFYVACGIWLVYRVLTYSFFSAHLLQIPILQENTIDYFVRLLLVICELGILINRGYSRSDAYALLVAFLMCAGPLYMKNSTYLHAVLLIFVSRSFEVRKTIKICSVIIALSVLFVILCAGVGIIPDVVMDEGSRVRHCLGFLFFLHPSMYVFMLTSVVCFLRGESISIFECVLLLFINILMFVLTDSQTSFGLAVLLVLAVLLLKIPAVSNINLGWLWRVLSWSFLLALAISIILTLLYGLFHSFGLNWLDALDNATRGRCSFGFSGIQKYGVTAWGQYVPWQGNGLNFYGYNPHVAEYNYVDNMFVHMLLDQGWIYVLGYAFLCTAVTRKAFKEGDHVLLLAMAAIAAYCILNDLTMYLHFNLLLFLIAGLFSCERSRPKEEAREALA